MWLGLGKKQLIVGKKWKIGGKKNAWFDSTASYSRLEHYLAQGTGRADPSNMAEFTFQQLGDMATGILLELDTAGVSRWDIVIIILIILTILIILLGIIKNN